MYAYIHPLVWDSALIRLFDESRIICVCVSWFNTDLYFIIFRLGQF